MAYTDPKPEAPIPQPAISVADLAALLRVPVADDKPDTKHNKPHKQNKKK